MKTKNANKNAENPLQKKSSPFRRILMYSAGTAVATAALLLLYLYIDDRRNGPLDSWMDRINRALNGGLPFRDYILLSEDSAGFLTGDGYYRFEEHLGRGEDVTDEGAEPTFSFRFRIPRDYFISPGVVIRDEFVDMEADALERGVEDPDWHIDRYMGDFTMEDVFGNHLGMSWWALSELDSRAAKASGDLQVIRTRVNHINDALKNQAPDDHTSAWHSCFLESIDIAALRRGDNAALSERYRNAPPEMLQCPNLVVNVLIKHSPFDSGERDLGDNIMVPRTLQEYIGYLYFMPDQGHLMALRAKYSNNQINYAMAKIELDRMGFTEEETREKLLKLGTLKEHFKPETIERLEKMTRDATSNPYLIVDHLRRELVGRYIEFIKDNESFMKQESTVPPASQSQTADQ